MVLHSFATLEVVIVVVEMNYLVLSPTISPGINSIFLDAFVKNCLSIESLGLCNCMHGVWTAPFA